MRITWQGSLSWVHANNPLGMSVLSQAIDGPGGADQYL